ncbi:flavin-containing monooxygenase [Nocardia wallacei]|uniref:flavin-containing monooxygenase n=1 Tax=Nocardia wallacei TaxID=480035 RepID=UPI0024542688|nr:NAD(P)/FAD-dependent oxidoreductase [Nocardia wallacei]
MDAEYVETVIIGAGHQGCGVAGALQQWGCDAVVVERADIGQAWAHERWDSLRVGSGNQSIRLPGWDYDGDDPLGLPSGPQVADYLRRYVATRDLRVLQHTPVHLVEAPAPTWDGEPVRFRTHVDGGSIIESRNVVAATGGYARPRIPDLASTIDPSVHQLHSRYYRNPRTLPDGSVLVVGAGISGQQIADELVDAGRDVFVAVGRHRAWPGFYRGHDIHEWIRVFSLFDDFVTPEPELAEGRDPARLPGLPVNGLNGSELNLGTLADKGATLIGSIRAAHGHILGLADNVVEIAEQSARSFQRILDKIDAGIGQRGFVAPVQSPPPRVNTDRVKNFGPEFDLVAHGVGTIIWCTGFGPDYRILPANALDEEWHPIADKGIVGSIPGLYYAGLPDGNSLALTSLAASSQTGPFIAQQIHWDHISRTQ